MVEIKNVSYSYENAVAEGALKNVCLRVPQGQVVLLCGVSGSGKTTFGRLVNGLIPCYYEGALTGSVTVNGKDTSAIQLHAFAGTVGSVFQNPKSQFYTLLTDTELVFACENVGMEKGEILRRFAETVSDFRIEKLLGKNVSELSGGEKQKIACASVCMLQPPVLVLDEPTSNLDVSTIRELREIVGRWKKAGKTIFIAEHRLWWLRGIADRVVVFRNGAIVEDVSAEAFWQRTPDALHAAGLRSPCRFTPREKTYCMDAQYKISPFCVSTGSGFTLRVPELTIPKGVVVAVLGSNGAGKSTFARCLCGLVRKCKAQISDGETRYAGRKLNRLVYMVFQDVNHQLFSESVSEDVTLGLNLPESEKRSAAEDALRRMELWDYRDAHPMALSGGQKQRLAIAGALAARKDVLFYDEPTSGLDYRNMERVAENIRRLSAMGKTQFVITHDPELVEKCCDYFLFFENGEITGSGAWTTESVDRLRAYFDCAAEA